MEQLTVYHGGAQVLRRPRRGGGRPWGDFGPGFYCTAQRELAEEWACGRSTDGYVSAYILETGGLRIWDLTREEQGLLQWLALTASQRRMAWTADAMEQAAVWLEACFLERLADTDVVIGWRGDDAHFSYAKAFLRNEVPLRVLEETVAPTAPQVFLRTPGAMAALRFQGYTVADATVCVPRRLARDAASRAAYAAARAAAGLTAPVADPQAEAEETLGEALDYAVHTCGLAADDFLALWDACGLAAAFARGVRPWTGGVSGTELAGETLAQAGLLRELPPVRRGAADSPESWCGRILARYQRRIGCSFRRLRQLLPAEELLRLAPALRGRPWPELASVLDRLCARKEAPTALQTRRRALGLSQRDLSRQTGVSLRMIQQYEQRVKEIDRAAGTNLLALSRALGCAMEDLLEPALPETAE